MKIAHLPMYNLPAMQPANAAFWRVIHDLLSEDGVDAPAELSFQSPPVPDKIGREVLFTQTCGYPLQTRYTGQYRLLGRPSYAAPGCQGSSHSAFLIVRADASFETVETLRDATFALNSRHSNSGFNLPRRLLAPLARDGRFFGQVIETGSHGASIKLVAQGGADVASVDCLTYVFYGDHQPDAVANLRVLAQTPLSPAIPFVTSCATDEPTRAALRRALLSIAADPRHQPVLQALRICDIEDAREDDYAVLMRYEAEAAEPGYPDIA